MDARRKRWLAALVVFLVWVAGLGTMAVFSARRPAQHRAGYRSAVDSDPGVFRVLSGCYPNVDGRSSVLW